jgi:S1-C subfamily serine protease
MRYLLTAASVAALVVGGAYAALPSPAGPSGPGSTLRLERITTSGHGSGVHLGGGVILTAWHVVNGEPTMTVVDDAGRKRPGEVLWTNPDYDVALIRISDYAGVASAPLSCKPPAIGAHVRAFGNPLSITFVSTYGHVVGATRTVAQWRAGVILDISLAPGMSGGPVFNDDGEVVAMATGMALIKKLGASGFAVAVPGSAICPLLGRSAA